VDGTPQRGPGQCPGWGPVEAEAFCHGRKFNELEVDTAKLITHLSHGAKEGAVICQGALFVASIGVEQAVLCKLLKSANSRHSRPNIFVYSVDLFVFTDSTFEVEQPEISNEIAYTALTFVQSENYKQLSAVSRDVY